MAGGATIDHIIAVTVLLTAMLLAMMTFNGLFAQALEYDRNRQVANKAVDLVNTICLSPGSPATWSKTNEPLTGFGLQDPDAGGYTLSPYAIMRLNTASDDSQLVYSEVTDTWYNNVSTNYGHGILTPIDNCVNYATAAELLGIDGAYGFGLDITPTLDVNVTQVSTDPLKINVQVHGGGLPLSNATLTSHLFEIKQDLSIVSYSNVTKTNHFGSTELEFSGITDDEPVYSFVVYVSIGGITGVGYFTNNTITDNSFIVPLVTNFDTGELILAHSTVINNPGGQANVFFNASFFILNSDFNVTEYDLDFSGQLTYGNGFHSVPTQIPASEVGLLVVSYKAQGINQLGNIIVPWGVGALGVSASFDGEFGSEGYNFVATELRQVLINGISYQVKVSTWKLGN
ncbi:MAG: hypothetical protein QCH99_02275 [Candidatus Bathyarchaeota archaeon]|nr:hypothetical protein [Candidatus Bathyarchaeum tardum]WGM89135.1 MAG: hypothetical protein NUK63_09505 [Candidatus Bathyarchaeum tardum]